MRGHKAAIVWCFEDYRAWISKVFSNNWKDSTPAKIKKVHGLPPSYPCRVWFEYRDLTEDEMWGPGPDKVQEIKMMTPDEFWVRYGRPKKTEKTC